jgi:polar amino acid transport system substrate-binding protein
LFARDANPELEYIEMSKQPLDEEGNPLRGGYGAIGFRKADISLIAAWNDWLKQAKESGELLRLLEPFGFTEDNIAPEGVTTAELCARK